MKNMTKRCGNLFPAASYSCRGVAILLVIVLTSCKKSTASFQKDIFDAARDGDLAIVKAAVQADPKVLSQTDYFNRTLLQDATLGGQVEVMKFLLDDGAKVGWCLPIAVSKQNLAATKLLIDHKALVNASNDEGWTPLMIATSTGPSGDLPDDIVKLLLDHGANVAAENSSGGTALDYAVGEGRTRIVKLLLNHHADINAKDSSKGGAGWTPLHHAAANGLKDTNSIVELLLANGANIDALDNFGRTPLDIAAAEISNTYMKNMGPLQIAKLQSYVGVVELLRSHKSRYTIYDAATMGDLKEVESLTKANPSSIFGKDSYGKTPLHYAASLKPKDMVEFLLSAKADSSAKDNEGETPLHLAAENDRLEIAQLLLAHNANVNAATNAHAMPLHYAAMSESNYADMADLLLAHGADVNAKTDAGRTPLALAIRDSDVAVLLIRHGGH